MKRIDVDGGQIHLTLERTPAQEGPHVRLTVRGRGEVTLSLTANEAHALATALGEVLTDLPRRWDASHDGRHPEHDPGPDPDAIAHRPAIGGAPLGVVGAERMPRTDDETLP